MDDLLQKQIRDSCKLALPDGLQDLMSDISREVLRAQPQNLLQFITDYLAALLVARENLFIASRVCDNVCKTSCYPELEDELREVGLNDDDVEKIVKVVTDFFESGGVKETNLMIKLLKKTEIDETQLPAVLAAVRGAFLRHQVNNTVIYESSSTDSDMDESLIAAKHTLKMYRKTKEPGDNYNSIVEKIQAAYRAYNVRRQFQRQNRERAASPVKKHIAADKALRFDAKKVELLFPGTPRSKRCSSKASSVSLAGSLVPLPSYKPYSIDDIFSEVDEVSEKEKEHNSFDYTQHWNNAPAWNEPGDKQKDTSIKKKNISFHDLPQIINKNSEEVNDEIPEEIENEDEEFEEVDEEFLEEQLVKDHALWPHCYTKPMENKDEVKNTFLTEIIHEITNYDQVTRTTHDNFTKPLEENKMNKELAPVPIIKENIAEQQKVNDEVKGQDDDDVVVEELTHVPALARMIKKQTIRIGDGAELIAKNYEAENKDDDEIIAEEFINDLVPREILEEEMMWYADDYERDIDDSDGESQEDVNIVEYFDNVSAAASFSDLS